MSLVDRLGRKTWSDEQVSKYVGPHAGVYFSYATDARFRQRSASGGTTTALLADQLTHGDIDGALVVRSTVEDGAVGTRFVIATTVEELIAAQGSVYAPVRFGNEELDMIERFPGRLAAVLLPCDATKLCRARSRNAALDEKIRLIIALFCGHNSETELVQRVADRLGKGHGRLTALHYRSGHWRGQFTTSYEDGTRVQRPFHCLSDYRNLYFFSQAKCHHCFDHFGYHCDISAGDIWSLSMRSHPIKHTALIIRTAGGQAAFGGALERRAIASQTRGVREVMDGQSRTLPFHYNVSARAAVAPLFGIKMLDPLREKVRLVDYAVAFLALLNHSVTKSRRGQRIVMRLPRPLLRVYLWFFKSLELL